MDDGDDDDTVAAWCHSVHPGTSLYHGRIL